MTLHYPVEVTHCCWATQNSCIGANGPKAKQRNGYWSMMCLCGQQNQLIPCEHILHYYEITTSYTAPTWELGSILIISPNKMDCLSSDHATPCHLSKVHLASSRAQMRRCVQCRGVKGDIMLGFLLLETKDCWIDQINMQLVSPALNMELICRLSVTADNSNQTPLVTILKEP